MAANLFPMKRIQLIYAAMVLLAVCSVSARLVEAKARASAVDKVAAKPLYRDPVYDGASDPTIIISRYPVLPLTERWRSVSRNVGSQVVTA